MLNSEGRHLNAEMSALLDLYSRKGPGFLLPDPLVRAQPGPEQPLHLERI